MYISLQVSLSNILDLEYKDFRHHFAALEKKEIEEIMERVSENGKMNFHDFIMMCIPSKFTIDFTEIPKIPEYAKNKKKISPED